MATTTAVETKAEPKVVADAGLMKLLRDYDKVDNKATGYFVTVVRYAKDHKLSRGSILASLKEVRPDMAESTLNSEASRILNFCKPEHEDVLEEMEQGKISQTEARAKVSKKQVNPAGKKKDEEVKLREKIFSSARYALKNVELTEEEDDEDTANEEATEAFLDLCKEEFEKALKVYPILESQEAEEEEEAKVAA